MAGKKLAEGEKSDLNLHVELCSERYSRLEEKFDQVERRLEHLHTDFDAYKRTITKAPKGKIEETALKLFENYLRKL